MIIVVSSSIMKYLYSKLKSLIPFVVRLEYKRLFYKAIFFTLAFSTLLRQRALFLLTSLGVSSSLSNLKLRCLFSNNSRSLLVFFKLSRYKFRMLAASGLLNGIRKSS
jgi:ribosomal protein S14